MEMEQMNSKLSCRNCSKTFFTNSMLQIHNTIVHAQVKSFYHCEICQTLLYTKTEFDLHYQESHKQEEIPRTYSKTEQISVEQINSLNNKLESDPSVTNSCKINQEKINLSMPNILVDKKISAIKCHICFKILSGQKILARHIQTVHDTLEIYSCQICNKDFSRKDTLSKHNIKVHGKTSLDSRKSFFRLKNQLSHKISGLEK